jgi:hypothetical protein
MLLTVADGRCEAEGNHDANGGFYINCCTLKEMYVIPLRQVPSVAVRFRTVECGNEQA